MNKENNQITVREGQRVIYGNKEFTVERVLNEKKVILSDGEVVSIDKLEAIIEDDGGEEDLYDAVASYRRNHPEENNQAPTKQSEVLRWVKASERSPEKEGYYCVKVYQRPNVKDRHIIHNTLYWNTNEWSFGDKPLEWLEETTTPTPAKDEFTELLLGKRGEYMHKLETTGNYGDAVAYQDKIDAIDTLLKNDPQVF